MAAGKRKQILKAEIFNLFAYFTAQCWPLTKFSAGCKACEAMCGHQAEVQLKIADCKVAQLRHGTNQGDVSGGDGHGLI
jgi:hypothetical protein